MFRLTAVGQLNYEPPVHCALTVGAFCLYCSRYNSQQMVPLAFQPATSPGTVSEEDCYNMDSDTIVTISQSVKSSVFKPIITLLTVLSSIITCKLNL